MSPPDFEALRAERNASARKAIEKLRADGWEVSLCSLHDENACYCDCANGGPCEHSWDGDPYESGDGAWSATCSRCGMTAISHSLRVCA